MPSGRFEHLDPNTSQLPRARGKHTSDFKRYGVAISVGNVSLNIDPTLTVNPSKFPPFVPGMSRNSDEEIGLSKFPEVTGAEERRTQDTRSRREVSPA